MLPTLLLRHRRENLDKCTLRGLENRDDCHFLTYPRDPLPPLNGYLVLALEGPELSAADASSGLLLIDGTWRYATTMLQFLYRSGPITTRTLPASLRTAYPRRQPDCKEPERGLASIEALYAAYRLLGRSTEGLLDNYHWKEAFLEQNWNLATYS